MEHYDMFRQFVATIKNKLQKGVRRNKQRSPMMATNPLYKQYTIGEWSYGHPLVLSWGEGATLRIGKFCSIADGVVIMLGGNHRSDWVTTYPFSNFFLEAREVVGHPQTNGNVNIGNDVWIGYQSLILSGVSVGNGAVIGARSVVTRDVPAYSVVAGNPARHIRYRFDESSISSLERIAWWDWPLSKITKAMPTLLSADLSLFISRNDFPNIPASEKTF
jgi:virginiamycin A acetyltransferase